MRLHISIDDALVSELDRYVGRGNRSAFIAKTVERALGEARRWAEIDASLGGIEDSGHDWDPDPVAWVEAGRRQDEHRVG